METLNQIKIENNVSSIFIDTDGILVNKVNTSFVSLEELDKNFIHVKSITKGNSVFGIIDLEKNTNFGKYYVSYLEREYSKVYKALAIVTPSKWMRFKSIVLRKFPEKKFPVRLFSNDQQAREWLKRFL
jgi:hypothetical protein